MDFPKSVFDQIQQSLANQGRLGATRYYRTPEVIVPGAVGVPSISTPCTIRFPQPGLALAMYGTEISGTSAAYAQIGVRVQIGGTEDLFVDGQGGPSFIPMLALFGGTANWQPLMRRVIPGRDWTFFFRNSLASGEDAVPMCTIAFIGDTDVANMLQQANGR